jgi:hypothetical protein
MHARPVIRRIVGLAMAGVLVAACGGATGRADASRPGVVGNLPGTSASAATESFEASTGATTANPSPTPAAVVVTAPPLPTVGAHATPAATGSLTVTLTSPTKVSFSVPANVNCTIGRAYHMDTGVLVNGDSFEVSVDIAIYHGPDAYHATVKVEVTTSASGTQGGAVPGIPVTIVSSTKGSAQYSYTGSTTTVSGKISWVCSS